MWKTDQIPPPVSSARLDVPGIGHVTLSQYASGRWLAQMHIETGLISAHADTRADAAAAGERMAAVMPEIARLLAEAMAEPQEALPVADAGIMANCTLHGPHLAAMPCLPCAAGIR